MRRAPPTRLLLGGATAASVGLQRRWVQFDKTFEIETKLNKTYFDTHKAKPWVTKSTADYAMP